MRNVHFRFPSGAQKRRVLQLLNPICHRLIFQVSWWRDRWDSRSLGSLSMQRFWATDGHRKCTVFLFYLSWHYHIYIFKFLCARKDDYFENVAETNVLACKMLTSGCRPWLKNVACLSSLIPCYGQPRSKGLSSLPPLFSHRQWRQRRETLGTRLCYGYLNLTTYFSECQFHDLISPSPRLPQPLFRSKYSLNRIYPFLNWCSTSAQSVTSSSSSVSPTRSIAQKKSAMNKVNK